METMHWKDELGGKIYWWHHLWIEYTWGYLSHLWALLFWKWEKSVYVHCIYIPFFIWGLQQVLWLSAGENWKHSLWLYLHPQGVANSLTRGEACRTYNYLWPQWETWWKRGFLERSLPKEQIYFKPFFLGAFLKVQQKMRLSLCQSASWWSLILICS